MSPDLKACKEKALKLPMKERAELAEHLIASLDRAEEAEIEKLWVEEAERRYHAFKKGCIAARPTEEVFSAARAEKR